MIVSIVNVRPEYINQIKNTLDLLQKYEIDFFIHTILTSRNDSLEDMKSVYDYIKDFDNLLEWKIDRVGKSMYLEEDFKNIEPQEKNIKEIEEYINSIRSEISFSVRSPKPATNNSFLPKPRTMDDFLERSYCTANYSGLFILPDGQVTICEELYWNPRFLVGNILKQSLREIWNSPRALNLFYVKQEDFPSDSLCTTCNTFTQCRSVKQVCYKDIIKEFGSDKWYYPDLMCPKYIESQVV